MKTTMEPSQSEWEVPYILRRVFADAQAAEWLLAKQLEPPTALDISMMKFSVTADMCTVLETSDAGLFRQSKQSEIVPLQQQTPMPRTGSESPPSSQQENIITVQKSLPYTFSPPETMVWVCHGSSAQRAFLTMTDSRMPFSFLETPCEAVPGVRRAVTETTQEDVMVAIHTYLADGNSCLLCVRYFINSEIMPQKCAILLRSHPSSRYPRIEDVIESALAFELPDCQFCLLRRQAHGCQCSRMSLQRNRPMIPTYQLRDAWSAWSWCFVHYESSLKKDQVQLYNYSRQFGASRDFLYQVTPVLGHNQEHHVAGYQHYLNTVAKCFNTKVLSWGLPFQLDSEPLPLLGRIDPCLVEELPYNCDLGDLVELQESDESETKKRKLDEHNVFLDANVASLGGMLIKNESNASGSMEESQDPDMHCSEHQHFQQQQSLGELVSVQASEAKQTKRKPAKLDDPDSIASVNSYLAEIDSFHWNQGSRFLCQLCPTPTTFSRKYDLKRHVKSTHLPVQQQRCFVCGFCGFKFKRQQHLESHCRQVHPAS